MKTTSYLVSLLVGLATMAACTSQPTVPAGEFLIMGSLTQVSDSTVIQLYASEGRVMNFIAQDTVIGGQFQFADTLTTGPRYFMLSSRAEGFPGTWLSVWAAPGAYVKITGEDKLIRLWQVESTLPEQQEETNLLRAAWEDQKRNLAYQVEEDALIQKMHTTERSDTAQLRAIWSKVDSIRKLGEPIDLRIERAKIDYLKHAPITSVWLNQYALYASFLQWNKTSPLIADIKALYARMSEADKQTEQGQGITEYMNLEPVVNVGDEMVDGDLYDLEGNLHHLAEFKGRYILLDFWSRGCGPCIQSIPEMEESIELYKDNLSVVAISSDGEKGWKEFVAEKKMTGNQWNELRRGNTGLANRYQVTGIPHYVLISPDGKIKQMWSGYGPGSLKGKLKELI